MAMLAGWLCAANSFAEEGAPGGALPAERPYIHFEVRQTSRINLGSRTAIFNLVVPPILPPAPVPAVPVNAQPPTAEQLQAAEARMQKEYVVLFFTAMVIDRSVTALSWQHEGQQYRAFSNVDFNYFCGVHEIETADSVYWLLMGAGDQTREQAEAERTEAVAHGLAQFAVPIPQRAEFSVTRSEYVVAGGTAGESNGAFKWLDALHVYFDAHRDRLIADHTTREAARIVREQWLKNHPPVPQDTVINFWPVKSTNYRNLQSGGQP